MKLPDGITLSLAVAGALASSGRVAFAQCPDGTPPPCRAAAARVTPSVNSIAVLPFASRSPDTTDAFIAEGMTDEVGNQLTKLARLQVKARGIVASQWRRAADPLSVARALGVAWLLDGNVRRAGGQVVVNVELVRGTTGAQVWSSRFVRRDTDLFGTQTEVAESVAVLVGGRLTPGERAVLAKRPTRNNRAYTLYLLGNSLLARRSQDEVRRALTAYTEAVKLDPAFVAGWAGVSLARSVQYSWAAWSDDVPKDSLLVLAGVSATRAVALDSSSAEAWLAAGNVAFLKGELGAAHAAYERSLARDSLNAETWHFYGVMYGYDEENSLGLGTVATSLFRRALALDPTRRNTLRHLAVATRVQGQFAAAEALLDTALVLGPWGPGFSDRSFVRLRRGNVPGAIADLAELSKLDGIHRPSESVFSGIVAGDSAPARTQLAKLQAAAPTRPQLYISVALISALLGSRDEALSALESVKAWTNPNEPRCARNVTCSPSLATWRMMQDPAFAFLRGDARFERIWADVRPKVPWLRDGTRGTDLHRLAP